MTALMCAAGSGQVECVAALLSKNAATETRDAVRAAPRKRHLVSPLYTPTFGEADTWRKPTQETCAVTVTVWLHRRGSDARRVLGSVCALFSQTLRTALHFAALKGHHTVVRTLVARGADMDAANSVRLAWRVPLRATTSPHCGASALLL